MTVNDFLDHAEELANDGRPAWCRSAVSRAYYAAHHAGVDFLFAVGVRTTAVATRHVAAYNALLAIGTLDAAVRRAGRQLMNLHDRRNRADYDWDDLRLEQQDQAQDLVVIAREIVAALNECLDDQDRADEIWNHFRTWVPAHGAALGLTLV